MPVIYKQMLGRQKSLFNDHRRWEYTDIRSIDTKNVVLLQRRKSPSL